MDQFDEQFINKQFGDTPKEVKMTGFLPDDYNEPSRSNYMSFNDGTNTFRVLDHAVIGWEYWTEETIDGKIKNTPHRVKEEDSIPVEKVITNKFGNLNINFFWAFPVYNFDDKRIQILEITQKTIRKAIKGFVDNKKWGDPKDYNFEVTREKTPEGKTEYSVIAEPKEALDPTIIEQFKNMKLDMKVWMSGGDPFAK